MAIAQKNLEEYEKVLEGNDFLSKGDFPGKLDSEIMLAMKS